MKRYISIALMLIVFLHSELCHSEPTFGNEYVHIKVHVPKDGSEHSTQLSAAPHKVKVIHHYHHRRRRPSKKAAPKNHQSNHNALLESIVLSEVKKPIGSDHLEYINHAADIAEHITKPVETYVVKQDDSKPRKTINTFTIIEETKKIPQQHGDSDHYNEQSYHLTKQPIETIEVIDPKVPHRENAYNWKEVPAHIETVRVIDDSKKPYHTHANSYRNGARKQVETIKVIDASGDSYKAHNKNAGYRYESRQPKPQIETIRIIDSEVNSHQRPTYNYKSRPHTEEVIYETDVDPAGNGYHYAPHTKAVKITESKVSKHHSYNYHDFDERPIEIKSELPEEAKYYHGHYQDEVKSDGSFKYERPSSSGHNHNQHEDNYSLHYDSKPIYKQEEYDNHNDYTRSRDQYLPPRDKQNTLLDDEVSYKYMSAPEATHNGATDWPERREHDYTAAETYTGIDSYSAIDVQGVGSGGYQYPLPYP